MKKMLIAILFGTSIAALVGCISKTPPTNDDLESGMGPVSSVKMVPKEKMESDLAANNQPDYQQNNQAGYNEDNAQNRSPVDQYGSNSRLASQDISNPYSTAETESNMMQAPNNEPNVENTMHMPVANKTYSENINSLGSEREHSANVKNVPQPLMPDEPPAYGNKVPIPKQDVNPGSYASDMNFPGQSENDIDEPPLSPNAVVNTPQQNLSPDESSLEQVQPQGGNAISPDEPISESALTAPTQGYNTSAEAQELKQLNKS